MALTEQNARAVENFLMKPVSSQLLAFDQRGALKRLMAQSPNRRGPTVVSNGRTESIGSR